MDERRFDSLARTLARSTSRRAAVRALAGVAAGAVVGLRRREAAAAAAQELPLDLDLDLLLCLGLFPPRACIALDLPHVAEAACENGRCVITACDPGWADCDGQAANGCETPLGTPDDCSACCDACTSGVCQDGTCRLVNGVPCADGAACVSGLCVDGVCCDGSCEGPCAACNVAGSEGTCTPLTGTPCGQPASCANGVAHAPDTCDSLGACVGGTDTTCSPYACGATACRTTCATDADCVAGHHCDEGQCLPDEGLGEPCDEGSDCTTGICNPTSGICCVEACPDGVPCTGPDFTCCVPDCTGRTCGDDGCGGSCGTCEAGTHCLPAEGACVPLSQGTCPTGADTCVESGLLCNEHCHCFATVSGATFCGAGYGLCTVCESDADCEEVEPGYTCITRGPFCPPDCLETGGRSCASPCPLPIP